MPKRTNPFQQLVYSIQYQLAEGTVVTESKFLTDRETGSPVEVDIVVETTIGEIPLVLGIECTAESRSSTVEWVRVMIGKHEKLATNKVVLVSKSGFSEEAIKKAQANDMETITLEEAEKVNWAAYFNQLQDLRLASSSIEPIACNVTYEISESDRIDVTFGLNPNIYQQQEDKRVETTLRDHIMNVLASKKVGIGFFREWLKHPERDERDSFDLTFNGRPPDTSIEDEAGKLHSILEIEIKAKASIRSTPISLKPSKFVNAEVAHGTAENIFDQDEDADQHVMVTLVRQDGKPPKGVLMLPPKKDEARIFSMEFVDKENRQDGN